MPYVSDVIRKALDTELRTLTYILSGYGVGAITYCITKLCCSWLECHGTSFKTVNELIGVLECTKLELYRRVAAEYEDKKRDENGDVFVTISGRKS